MTLAAGALQDRLVYLTAVVNVSDETKVKIGAEEKEINGMNQMNGSGRTPLHSQASWEPGPMSV